MAGFDKNTIALLHFNNNSIDECGTIWTPSSSGVSYVDSWRNKGLNISGGYIKANKNIANSIGSGDYTVDFWIKIPSSWSSWNQIVTDRTSTSTQSNFWVSLDDSGAIIVYSALGETSSSKVVITGKTSLKNNIFNHVAFVKKDSIGYLYINGVLEASDSVYGIFYSNHPTMIGNELQPANFTIDEFRLSNIARWTSNFTPPTRPYSCDMLYIDENDNAYGFDNTDTFSIVGSNFSGLSDTDKYALFSYGGTATPSDLESLQNKKFKVTTLQDTAPKTKTTVKAIPKSQVTLPKKLISTSSFEHLNKVTVTKAESGNGTIKIAVTTDLSNYVIYDKVSQEWVSISSDDIASNGMTTDDIALLGTNEWDKLVSYEENSGVALAYYLDITDYTDSVKVDTLTFNVDMKGSWVKAEHVADYTYKYPLNNKLVVKILKDGSYKINYMK